MIVTEVRNVRKMSLSELLLNLDMPDIVDEYYRRMEWSNYDWAYRFEIGDPEPNGPGATPASKAECSRRRKAVRDYHDSNSFNVGETVVCYDTVLAVIMAKDTERPNCFLVNFGKKLECVATMGPGVYNMVALHTSKDNMRYCYASSLKHTDKKSVEFYEALRDSQWQSEAPKENLI